MKCFWFWHNWDIWSYTMTKYWITSDYRKIPIKYMTTTHLANAMHHCDTHKVPMFKPESVDIYYWW